MKWFGESWGAPICTADAHVDTPDAICCECAKDIQESDQGVLLPYAGPINQDDVFFKSVVFIDEHNDYEKITPHMVYHLDCLLRNIGVL